MAQTPELDEIFTDRTPVSCYLADARVTNPVPQVPGMLHPHERPGNYYISQEAHSLGPITPLVRYSLEPWIDPPRAVFQSWKSGNSLGQKTFLLTLLPDTIVVEKLWDAYKEPPETRDQEVSIYMQLSSLWNAIVPRLIGCVEINFSHSPLIERIEVFP